MPRIGLLLILLLSSFAGRAQAITPGQQAALNSYVDYANQSAADATWIFDRVLNYYSELKYYKKGDKAVRPFNCSNQMDDFYLNKVLQQNALPVGSVALNTGVKELRSAAEKLDKDCKSLDTYHKLQDYKQDKFAQADVLINQLQADLVDYRKGQANLSRAIESTYRKLQANVTGDPYHTTKSMMEKEIFQERNFLDLLSYNLNEDVHSGWLVDKLESSILETDNALAGFNQAKPALKYPASSMYGSFAEAIGTILSSKRSALDGYNFEAKKSDRHSNQAYLTLINYFNGTLVHDQNTFVQFSVTDHFYGLKAIQYVPLFEIRTAAESTQTEITPFRDIPYVHAKVVKQSIPIPPSLFTALTGYIEYINESVSQSDYLQRALKNYNSSASYYKDLTSFKGKGGLTYDYKNFHLPLSLYQAIGTQKVAVPAAYRQSLSDQTEVLQNILKEMDQLSVALSLDASTRAYEKDNLSKAYEILERYAVLFALLDDRKERLYSDLRAVFESYAVTNPAGSWIVSDKALLGLVDEDRVQLFKAKAFYRGDSTSVPNADVINSDLREVIAKEFDNMKGIERLGRYNGNCPYSPYEDIPNNSRTLGEKIQRIKTLPVSSYGGPHHEFVYMYNVIVDEYNKFCELAKVNLLKTVLQPEMFVVRYPKKTPEEGLSTNPKIYEEPATKPAAESEKPVTQMAGKIIHDTVKVTDIIRIETRRQDTIYIEKHDTIYVGRPGENPMSMDGYATNNLVFLLDVSGSMNAGQKLPLLKKSMLLLLKMLRPEDFVSIVVYSGNAKVALQPTSAQEGDKIRKVIEALRSKGETDGNTGIKLAYKIANGNYVRGGNNRIILATDGEFPISEETMGVAARFAREDIFISVFNFGSNSVSAKGLEKLCSAGKGNYEFITRANSDTKLIREAKAKGK